MSSSCPAPAPASLPTPLFCLSYLLFTAYPPLQPAGKAVIRTSRQSSGVRRMGGCFPKCLLGFLQYLPLGLQVAKCFGTGVPFMEPNDSIPHQHECECFHDASMPGGSERSPALRALTLGRWMLESEQQSRAADWLWAGGRWGEGR